MSTSTAAAQWRQPATITTSELHCRQHCVTFETDETSIHSAKERKKAVLTIDADFEWWWPSRPAKKPQTKHKINFITYAWSNANVRNWGYTADDSAKPQRSSWIRCALLVKESVMLMKNPVKLPVICYGPFRAAKPNLLPIRHRKSRQPCFFFLGCSKVNLTCELIFNKIVMGNITHQWFRSPLSDQTASVNTAPLRQLSANDLVGSWCRAASLPPPPPPPRCRRMPLPGKYHLELNHAPQ